VARRPQNDFPSLQPDGLMAGGFPRRRVHGFVPHTSSTPVSCLMKSIAVVASTVAATTPLSAQSLPEPGDVLAKMRVANAHFAREWPHVGKTIITTRERPSNIWTRSVYYEGLMALYAIDRDPSYYDYATRWADFHKWGLRSGPKSRNADDQCCGQIYLELYQVEPRPERIRDIQACMDNSVAIPQHDDWYWIDAIQMAMPVFAKLGALTKNPKYFEKAHALYEFTKTQHGGKGLYNPAHHLWWRDKDFVPPHTTPNGKDCYWSRGNGWVVAALARVLEVLPANAPHRAEYEQDLKDMLAAVAPLQRNDGFWNPSLHDPKDFPGKETTGTALFAYGMAWAVRHRLVAADEYLPRIAKAWHALAEEALHPDGFLGYVQGTGKQPSEGQPVTYDHQPDFTDYGLGCFLLAGSEVYRLAGR
jgi:unsaturated rhamnogalacturonyl hydrolase